jgi:hypothetical protein
MSGRQTALPSRSPRGRLQRFVMHSHFQGYHSALSPFWRGAWLGCQLLPSAAPNHLAYPSYARQLYFEMFSNPTHGRSSLLSPGGAAPPNPLTSFFVRRATRSNSLGLLHSLRFVPHGVHQHYRAIGGEGLLAFSTSFQPLAYLS